MTYSWVEVENTGPVVHRVTAHDKRPPALSLAQEFELLAPEEFAQTGEIFESSISIISIFQRREAQKANLFIFI